MKKLLFLPLLIVLIMSGLAPVQADSNYTKTIKVIDAGTKSPLEGTGVVIESYYHDKYYSIDKNKKYTGTDGKVSFSFTQSIEIPKADLQLELPGNQSYYIMVTGTKKGYVALQHKKLINIPVVSWVDANDKKQYKGQTGSSEYPYILTLIKSNIPAPGQKVPTVDKQQQPGKPPLD